MILTPQIRNKSFASVDMCSSTSVKLLLQKHPCKVKICTPFAFDGSINQALGGSDLAQWIPGFFLFRSFPGFTGDGRVFASVFCGTTVIKGGIRAESSTGVK